MTVEALVLSFQRSSVQFPQPEWIKESEMDCVDCSFVLLDSFYFFFYFGVILQCQSHTRIDSLFSANILQWHRIHQFLSLTFYKRRSIIIRAKNIREYTNTLFVSVGILD